MIQFQENHFTLRQEVEHGKNLLLSLRYDSQTKNQKYFFI